MLLKYEKTTGDSTEINPHKNSLWIIIGIIALNSIGMSVVLPLLPFLVGKYLGPAQVVVGMSALLSVYAGCTFFAAPVLGALSDRYGRKRILIISLSGSAIGYILFATGGSLWMLFLGRIIDGLTAGNISTLLACISDTTESKERTKWFGYMGATMGIGKIGGPALGGLLGSISISLPFYVTSAFILISGLAVYFLLPESLPPEKRIKRLTLESVNTFSHFKDIFILKNVRLLLVPGLFFYAGMGIFQFNFTVFLKDIYEWGPEPVGMLLTAIGVCEIVTRALLLPRLLRRMNEKRIGITGLFNLCIGLGLIAASTGIHSIVMIILAILFIISGEGLFETSYNGKLSQSVSESEQGKLQGVNQSLQSANNVLIPLAAAAIYVHSPGILYATAALIIFVGVMIYTYSADTNR